MNYDNYTPMTPYPPGMGYILAATATNIKGGDNPPYTVSDFLAYYPQFDANINEVILTKFVTMANAVVKESRWHEMWEMAMGLFIAHFATLYLQTLGDVENASASDVISAAQSRGLVSSESADGLSASYDMSSLSTDLEGWAMWKSTTFGAQYATLAKSFGAVMYVR